MADSALSSDPLERYGAIERDYCEERWMAVIHDGQSLLGDLERAEEPAPEGLKERLQLLIGHSFLYGIGDRDSAEDLYQAVLRSGAEPSLRQIAEQGLQQCILPIVPSADEVEDEVLEQRGQAAGDDAPASDAASLWQEPGADASLGDATTPAALSAIAPAEPAEPSALSDVPQDSWIPAEPPSSSSQAASLSWLTAETPSAPQDGAFQPVMPWLQGGGSPSSPAPTSLSERSGDRPDLAAVQEQPQPAADVPSPEQATSWLTSAAAPVQEDPASPADPTAAALALGAEQATAAPDETVASSPSLAPTPVAIAADLAAVFAQQSELPQSDPDPGSVAPPARPQDPGEPSGLLDALPAAPEPEAADQSSRMASAPGLRLVPEVVEEPELIELHQATAQVEEALLHPIDADPQSLSPPEPAVAVTAQPWLPTGVDRRGAEPVLSEPPPEELSLRPELDRRGAEPVSEAPPLRLVKQEEEIELAAPVVPAPNPATPARPSGRGPFSAPPEPVAEEDPELLMGLLKLEMG